ncbi:enterotoxin, partial [Bacillus toyonensis]
NQLMSILESKNSGISLLQQQINNYNNIIEKHSRKRMELSIFVPQSERIQAREEIQFAKQEIEKLKSKISGVEPEVAILTDAKNKT